MADWDRQNEAREKCFQLFSRRNSSSEKLNQQRNISELGIGETVVDEKKLLLNCCDRLPS